MRLDTRCLMYKHAVKNSNRNLCSMVAMLLIPFHPKVNYKSEYMFIVQAVTLYCWLSRAAHSLTYCSIRQTLCCQDPLESSQFSCLMLVAKAFTEKETLGFPIQRYPNAFPIFLCLDNHFWSWEVPTRAPCQKFTLLVSDAGQPKKLALTRTRSNITAPF